jgi:endonuclease/exonuclease/phosphatase family metal-dependent hydrolase
VSLRIVTWNLKYTRGDARRRLEHLGELNWDVALLQEVTPRAQTTLTESGIAADAAFGHPLQFGTDYDRGMGSAILVRGDYTLRDPTLIRGQPKDERGLWGQLEGPSLPEPIAVISWHAPNAAGQGVKTKMQGYRALIALLDELRGPIVLGFDSNHWNRRTELEPQEPTDASDRWYEENLFFSRTPQHRLRDAFLDHLRTNPGEYEKILSERPDGPLAVSYVRGTKAKPVADRFDYIFVSPEIRVISCAYDYERAAATGSDHASVTVELGFQP